MYKLANKYLSQARKILCVLCIAAVFCPSVFAKDAQHNTKLWTQVNVDGQFFNTKLDYLFEVHARFQDTNRALEQIVTRFGLGYHINPIVSLWLGYDFTPKRNNTSNEFENEHRLWQQLNVKAIHQVTFSLDSRTRLEERFSEDNSGTAHRLRQQFTLKLLKTVNKKITPILSDEIFFNLNHPSWVSEDNVDQNRLFVGFQFAITTKSTLKIGYLNQYRFRDPINKISHIISFGLSFHQ